MSVRCSHIRPACKHHRLPSFHHPTDFLPSFLPSFRRGRSPLQQHLARCWDAVDPRQLTAESESVESTHRSERPEQFCRCSVGKRRWIPPREPLNSFPPASSRSPSSTCSQTRGRPQQQPLPRRGPRLCHLSLTPGWGLGTLSCSPCARETRAPSHRANTWKALPVSWELATDSMIYCPDWGNFERLVSLSSAHLAGTAVEAERRNGRRRGLGLDSDLSASSTPC